VSMPVLLRSSGMCGGGGWRGVGKFSADVAGQEDGRTKAIRQRGNLLTLPLQMAGCVILIRAGANG
jgi:hypothetical protein